MATILNDFPENQQIKSRAVYTEKANLGLKFCRKLLTQDSRVTMITTGWTELTSFHCQTLIYNYNLEDKNWNHKSLGSIDPLSSPS